MSSYSDKLKDPRWQRKRLEVMEADGWTCRCCGDRTSTLNVHHLKYNANPWDADVEYLETLCEKCHEFRTRFNAHIKIIPTRLVRMMAAKIAWYDHWVKKHGPKQDQPTRPGRRGKHGPR